MKSHSYALLILSLTAVACGKKGAIEANSVQPQIAKASSGDSNVSPSDTSKPTASPEAAAPAEVETLQVLLPNQELASTNSADIVAVEGSAADIKNLASAPSTAPVSSAPVVVQTFGLDQDAIVGDEFTVSVQNDKGEEFVTEAKIKRGAARNNANVPDQSLFVSVKSLPNGVYIVRAKRGASSYIAPLRIPQSKGEQGSPEMLVTSKYFLMLREGDALASRDAEAFPELFPGCADAKQALLKAEKMLDTESEKFEKSNPDKLACKTDSDCSYSKSCFTPVVISEPYEKARDAALSKVTADLQAAKENQATKCGGGLAFGEKSTASCSAPPPSSAWPTCQNSRCMAAPLMDNGNLRDIFKIFGR